MEVKIVWENLHTSSFFKIWNENDQILGFRPNPNFVYSQSSQKNFHSNRLFCSCTTNAKYPPFWTKLSRAHNWEHLECCLWMDWNLLATQKSFKKCRTEDVWGIL